MQPVTTLIPLPLQIVIDDVGWWQGSGGTGQEPFRTGMPRRHHPDDLLPLAELGRRLSVRPQLAMVLAEWDVDGILRHLPEATWRGANWSGQPENADACARAADLLRQNRPFLEITLHGLGHEYWLPDGTRTRAEWYGSDGTPRPPDQIRQHLDAYAALLERHGLGPLPESFVPCAFCYAFGRGENELAGILHAYGVRRISTPFARMQRHRPTEGKLFGLDAGVVVTDRDTNPVPWNQLGVQPGQLGQIGSTLGLHWPNLLEHEPADRTDAVATVVAAVRAAGRGPGRTLAPHSAWHQTQLLYHELTRVQPADGGAILDFRPFLRLHGQHPRHRLEVQFIAPDQTCATVTITPDKYCQEYFLPLPK